MLAIARIQAIKEMLVQHKSVSVSDLAIGLKVTEETIRKDLTRLETEGFLKRTHGGAYLSQTVQNDISVAVREQLLVEGKETIAKACLPFIEDGDSIFLDCSTTCLGIAQKLLRRRITLITNSLKIAHLVATSKTIQLILLGGQLEQNSMSLIGPLALDNLSQYFVDKAFVSPSAVDVKIGLTDAHEGQGLVRRLALERAHMRFLLVDHTKLDKIAFSAIAPIKSIDRIICDEPLPPHYHELFPN